MPSSKDRVVDVDDRPREKWHRPKTERKERDREKDRDRDKDRERDPDRESRHHHHRSSKSSSKLRPTDSDTHSRPHRRHRTKDKEMEKDDPEYQPAAASSMTDVVPELTRGTDREWVGRPYPSFSKAHSKEFLHSKEDISTPVARRTDPLTPEATDLGGSEMKRSKSVDSPPVVRKVSSARKERRQDDRPPSPPETDLSAQKKRSGTPVSLREAERPDSRPGSRNSSYVSRTTSKTEVKSRVSKVSSQATYIQSPTFKPPSAESVHSVGPKDLSESGTAGIERLPIRSASVPAAAFSAAGPTPIEVYSSGSAPDSSPKTPTQVPQFPLPIISEEKKQPMRFEQESDVHNPSEVATETNTVGPPMPPPPPPPPPPLNFQEVPRVDYLMQNGGLPQPVPKTFLSALPRQNGTRPSNPPLQGAETLFAPFFNLLNQYQSVLNGHGSIAVATGHRTVARRLLDRLENVFSRDLPPDGCYCVMCEHSDEPHRGLGWGEVLERVSGRVDLPQWPPFDLALLGTKAVEDLADVPARPASPVKMDPDIGEEFREHYLRQSKRVRAAVDKWMSNCDRAPAPTPQEVDDETLSFAILTNLEQEDRPYFNALLSGSRDLHPALRAPTPVRKPRNDFVVRTGLSIQRLYRLTMAPRDAESALYLVKNPAMHDLLHTISEINPSEWEILISGRFDGFLWSGAEDDGVEGPSRGTTPASGFYPGPPRVLSMTPGMGSRPGTGMGSRGPTPFSRGATPASFISSVSAATSSYPSRAAVSHDEEAEIAVAAELEREIFNGMEALEDAFEKLHEQAITVRDALRRRGAALSMSLQQRRGGLFGSRIDVLPLSGSSGAYDRPSWADEESQLDGYGGGDSEWGGDDVSELAPDDSASQISSSRTRRPKRRRERATPAPIEEEEEEQNG
ncbi:hypothetical protein B0H66DRAFT_87128 [Apodospora peruviana]|uniref:5-methylcytosine g t mismatch-specific dna n=1 Tax=Apodospora peruviana TaxID=516989 RepID=A0AAE0MGP9_9PEZI|nr:hypothetical protein B0H66DRAFT_87128 [Apodospora peruviana]